MKTQANQKAHISVIIAVRDAATTLAEAVGSIQQQTLSPREILLVLNGCRDASPEITRALAKNDDRIRILESETQDGVAGAARLGCEQACSPLLARMDADDLAHPRRLEEQLAVLSAYQADLVTSRIRPYQSLGEGMERYVAWANSLQKPEDFRRERFVESPVIQPGVLMTRTAYEQAGGYRVEDGPEDYDLWLRMLAAGARFYQAPQAILDWRDSHTRLTRSHADYSEQQMRATKARFLGQLAKVRAEGVLIVGSGPNGRRLTKLLQAEGVVVRGFFEVAPRKIGRTALGLPIWDARELGQHPGILLGCVGRGGRERVREWAIAGGYCEGEDFFACC